jgi:putative (di)nucleoside polyphosphate hydrolase
MARRLTSCGVLVTDGALLLLGHATHSPRWDIPKGIADPGESLAVAAARELAEETSLHVPADALRDLGVHAYLRGKDLALFEWRPARLPDAAALRCHSTFLLPNGSVAPEFDRFRVVSWEAALTMVGKNMARVLGDVRSQHFPAGNQSPKICSSA